MSGTRYLVDAQPLLAQGSGIQRFARQVILRLDECAPAGALRMAYPPPIIGRIPLLWQQIVFPLRAFLTGRCPLSLCNTLPLFHPGVVCIHDIFYKTHPQFYAGSFRGRLSGVWHRLHYRWAALRARRILTVSEYSKAELMRAYGIAASRISVVGNGWEHVTSVRPDDGIFRRLRLSPDTPYFLMAGNLARYKNVRWTLAAARQHPEQTFVIAGRIMRSAWSDSDCELPTRNVRFAGFVSDGEMKSLLQHCRALVQPALMEGFGIAPLEALALGRPIVVSRRAALPEVFGGAAHYIEDPEDCTHADPESLLSGRTDSAAPVLRRWTWKLAARRLGASLGWDTIDSASPDVV